MQPIVSGVSTFPGLRVGRVYLIEDPDGLTLVDCGMASAAPRILAGLRAAGHAPAEVKRILITHAHFDHVGGLAALKAATGAEVIALAAEQPYLSGAARLPLAPWEDLGPAGRIMASFMRTAPLPPPTPADRLLADGEVLPEVLGGLRVVATPGHTPGHAAYWQPERRVLFCGDAIMHMRGLSLPFAAPTGDMAEARRSAARLAELAPETVCFGHGPALTQGAAGALRTFARKVNPG